MTSKGAAGATYKTYHNALIRSGTYNPTPEGYLKHVEEYWRDKVVGKLKKQQNIDVKVEIGEQIMSELKGLKKLLINLTKFQGYELIYDFEEHQMISLMVVCIFPKKVNY